MPKRAADESSGDDEGGEKDNASTKGGDAKKADLQTDTEKNMYLDLGGNKRCTVSMFRGHAQMNIREYYVDKSSQELRPGKKGITLNSAQWSTLVAAIGPLTQQLEERQKTDSDVKEVGGKKKKEKKESSKKDKKPANKKRKKAASSDEEDEEDD